MPPPGGLMASCERPGVRSRRKTTKVSVFSLLLSLSLWSPHLVWGAVGQTVASPNGDLELEFRISKRVEIAE